MRTLLLLLAAAPALASDGEDLPTMIARYGWATGAAVVRSAAAGDQTTAQAHARLRALGLDRVEIRIEVDRALPAPHAAGPLMGCGYNDGVYCALDLPPGAPTAFVLQCLKGRALLDVPVAFVVDPRPTSETAGVAHVGDLLPCWESGGDRLRAVPLPQATAAPPSAQGWTVQAAREALGEALSAIAACGRPEHRITIARSQPDDAPELTLRLDDREDVQATACARRALDAHGGQARLQDMPAGARVEFPAR